MPKGTFSPTGTGSPEGKSVGLHVRGWRGTGEGGGWERGFAQGIPS